MASYIPDGYTREGFIAASVPEASGEQLHEELEFSYRPATRMDVVKLDAEIRIAIRNHEFDPVCAIRAEQLACRFVAERIIAWSLRDPRQQAITVSSTACERLQPALFHKLYNIIRGTEANDARPHHLSEPSDDEQLKN